MAVGTGDLVGLRMMRQPLVAARAGLVALVQRDLLDARPVTTCTRRRQRIAQRELELVGLVATGAGGSAVRAVIGGRELVTRSAGAHLDGGGDLGRMRIVAAYAAPGLFRVVGVNVLVAGRAGRCWRRFHVVRRVAAGAGAVRRDATATDHVHLGVAAAAGGGVFFLEIVRLMTTNALRVAAREQSRCRNDGLLLGVTRGARSDRFCGRRVPLHVAGRASLDQ